MKLYVERRGGAKIRTAKGMDDAFRNPQSEPVREIHSLRPPMIRSQKPQLRATTALST